MRAGRIVLLCVIILTALTVVSSAGPSPVQAKERIVWFYSEAAEAPRSCDDPRLTDGEIEMCALISG